MNEELKGQQHKIDANKNKKIDAHDFKLLRAKKDMKESEQLQEYEAKDGVYRHQAKTGRYGGSEKPTDPFAGVRGPKTSELTAIEKEKMKKKKKFSEMVDVYKSAGIKGLFEQIQLAQEEASQEEYNKELEKQKAKAEGKAPQADVAAPAGEPCKKSMDEEVEQLDELSPGTLKSYIKGAKSDKAAHNDEKFSAMAADDHKTASDAAHRVAKRQSGIKSAKAKMNVEEVEQIEERELTAGETKKKEDIVKGMKKGIAGFKERYGERAKEVMYATATKKAKGE